MKAIRILKIKNQFTVNPRGQLEVAARKISERTGFNITPTETGFTLSGEWRGKYASEDAFAHRIARDLEIASGVTFDAVVGG